MARERCFGGYDYSHTCLRCPQGSRCLDETRSADMNNKKTEGKDERKERLDNEWINSILPCTNCSDKMKRLCKYYNTFKRPDYAPIFHVVVTCDDFEEQLRYPDDTVPVADGVNTDVFKSANLLHGNGGI